VLGAAPNWAEIVTAIGSALAGATLVVAVVAALFALRQLREIRRDRHVELIAELGRRWDDERMAQSRAPARRYDSHQLAERLGAWVASRDAAEIDTERERETLQLMRVPNFLEDVALMVEAGSMTPELIDRSLGSITTATWEFWEEAVEEMRKQDPTIYVEFERLARGVAEREATLPQSQRERVRPRRGPQAASADAEGESELDQQA
jgi:hypothetical protein